MLRRYLNSRRRTSQNISSVSYRDLIGKVQRVKVNPDQRPLTILHASRTVPCPHGRVPPPEDDDMGAEEQSEEERYVVWGGHLETVKDVAEPSDSRDDSKKVDLHIGAQPRLKGTGFAALGTTKAFASVYGPCPLGRRMTYSDDGYLRTQVKLMTNSRAERLEEKVKNRSASREERELSAFLRMALRPALLLESFPKSQVFVRVLVIEDDGGALPAAILASCLALSASSLPCCDIVTCGTIAMQARNSIIQNPSKREEYDLQRVLSLPNATMNVGAATVACLPHVRQVSMFDLAGKMGVKTAKKLAKLAHSEAWAFLEPLEQRMVSYAVWAMEANQDGARMAKMPRLEEPFDDIDVQAVAKNVSEMVTEEDV